jgi:hypothetical protein
MDENPYKAPQGDTIWVKVFFGCLLVGGGATFCYMLFQFIRAFWPLFRGP